MMRKLIPFLIGVMFLLSLSQASFAAGQWEILSPTTSPDARTDHAMATTADGDVLLFGGRIDDKSTATDETFIFHDGNWSEPTLSSGPDARIGHAMVLAYDSHVYLFGGVGWGTGNEFYEDIWRFNGNTYDWESITVSGDKPAGRQEHAMVALPDGRVMIAGGYNGSKAHLDDAWIFEPDDNTWTEVASMPHSMQYVVAVISNTNNEATGDMSVYCFSDDGNARYDINSDSWIAFTTSGDVPATFANAVSLQVQNRFWVMGGFSPSGGDDLNQVITATMGDILCTGDTSAMNLTVSATNEHYGAFAAAVYGSDPRQIACPAAKNEPLQIIVFGGRNETFEYINTTSLYTPGYEFPASDDDDDDDDTGDDDDAIDDDDTTDDDDAADDDDTDDDVTDDDDEAGSSDDDDDDDDSGCCG